MHATSVGWPMSEPYFLTLGASVQWPHTFIERRERIYCDVFAENFGCDGQPFPSDALESKGSQVLRWLSFDRPK